MKFRLKIKTTLKFPQDLLVEKVNTYLKRNSYRITERDANYIIFVEDEFSDRRRSRSDVHKRIREGKFTFSSYTEKETNVELIYLTSYSYYAAIVLIASTFGIYVKNMIMPIVFSIAFALPILVKIIYLNNHVFEEIKEC